VTSPATAASVPRTASAKAIDAGSRNRRTSASRTAPRKSENRMATNSSRKMSAALNNSPNNRTVATVDARTGASDGGSRVSRHPFCLWSGSSISACTVSSSGTAGPQLPLLGETAADQSHLLLQGEQLRIGPGATGRLLQQLEVALEAVA
jgi:hypothetical protein